MDTANLLMNTIADLLSPADVLLDCDATTKRGVFEQVGALLERRHGLDRAQVSNALYARERLGSTGLGHGVALPHARLKGLPQPVAAFVRTRMPIPFDAPDAKPVSDMIVLIVPDKSTDLHLQLLAEVAQLFADKAFREQLRTCTDGDAVHRLISARAMR
jgi:PTS system nitrogen regulatory IIA component